jgi:predicted anti-sigma-YlaC factor YlaD
MNRCERCQPLILDHLYGLLDGPDEAFVDAHLRDCAACAAVRDESARVQGLFARAARGAFPQVRFEAPSATPTATPTPAPMPALASPAVPAARPGRTGWRVAAWLPWAVAAAVWLAIPGTV